MTWANWPNILVWSACSLSTVLLCLAFIQKHHWIRLIYFKRIKQQIYICISSQQITRNIHLSDEKTKSKVERDKQHSEKTQEKNGTQIFRTCSLFSTEIHNWNQSAHFHSVFKRCCHNKKAQTMHVVHVFWNEAVQFWLSGKILIKI